jgi:hypothetical protein
MKMKSRSTSLQALPEKQLQQCEVEYMVNQTAIQ